MVGVVDLSQGQPQLLLFVRERLGGDGRVWGFRSGADLTGGEAQGVVGVRGTAEDLPEAVALLAVQLGRPGPVRAAPAALAVRTAAPELQAVVGLLLTLDE